MAAIDVIRAKVRGQEYEFTVPHFFEEMAQDDRHDAESTEEVDIAVTAWGSCLRQREQVRHRGSVRGDKISIPPLPRPPPWA